MAGADADEIQKRTRGSNGCAGVNSAAPLGTAVQGPEALFALRATEQQADKCVQRMDRGYDGISRTQPFKRSQPASLLAIRARISAIRTAVWMSAAAKAQTSSDQEFFAGRRDDASRGNSTPI